MRLATCWKGTEQVFRWLDCKLHWRTCTRSTCGCTTCPPPCSQSPPGSPSCCRPPPTPPAPPCWSPFFFVRSGCSMQWSGTRQTRTGVPKMLTHLHISKYPQYRLKSSSSFCWGMTALETWCLAMIGLVFEALLAYVVVLFWLFREKALQVWNNSSWSKLSVIAWQIPTIDNQKAGLMLFYHIFCKKDSSQVPQPTCFLTFKAVGEPD